MSKFAPPVPYSDEKHGRYLERAKSELTEKDKEGKTPEEIIQLEKEMAIYIRNQEMQKVEIKRAQEDLGSMATITQGKGLAIFRFRGREFEEFRGLLNISVCFFDLFLADVILNSRKHVYGD